MSSGINPIDLNLASNYIVLTNLNILNYMTEINGTKLEQYNSDVNKVESDEDTQAVSEKEDVDNTQKIQSEQNAQTYYDKQIIEDALNLAADLGIYVSAGSDIQTLMDNIKSRLDDLKSAFNGNENLNGVVEEYSNRYDYIFAQYMDKKAVLQNQVLTTLDVMSLNNIASSGM